MSKEIKLNLKVDSKSGTASIKKVKNSVNTLSDTSVKAAKKASKAWDKTNKSILSLNKSFKKLATVTAASATGLVYLAKKSLDGADKIAKLSDSIGISATKLQEYNYAAGLSGISTEELSSGLVAFTKRLGEAKTGTGALSSYLKNSNKSLLDQLKNVDSASQGLDVFMKALGDTETATDKAALAAAAFGRGAGVKMTVMVKDGADSLNTMKKEAHDLGLVLGTELLRNAERLNDDMSKLSQVVSTQFTKAILELAPEIEKVAKDMLSWVKSNKELISQNVGATIDEIEGALKKIWTVISYSPAIIEWGLLGLAIFGKKGAVVLGGLAHISKAIINLGAGLRLVNEGAITFSDLMQANFKDLEKILNEIKPPTFLQLIERDAEMLKERIKDLKKQTGGIFFFAEDKEELVRLQELLESTLRLIDNVKTRDYVTITTPGGETETDPDAEAGARKKELTDAEKAAAAKIKLRKDVLEEFRRAQLSETQLALDNLNIQKARFEEFVKNKKALDDWYNGEKAKIAKVGHDQVLEYISSEEENTIRSIKKMRDDLLLFAKTAEEMDAINLTAELKIKEVKTGPKEASAFVDAWESALDEVESLFSDVFSDAISGELDSFGNYFKALMNNLQKITADNLAKMLLDWIKNLAKKKAAAAAAKAAAASGKKIDTTSDVKDSVSGGGGNLILTAVMAIVTYFMSQSAKLKAATKLRAATHKATIKAYNALAATLKENTIALDAQRAATHSFSSAFTEAVKTYTADMKKISELYGLPTTTTDSSMSAQQVALVNYYKKLSLVVKDIAKSLSDFEDSIKALSMTSYELKMLEVHTYYKDMELAIKDTITYQKALASQIATLEASSTDYTYSQYRTAGDLTSATTAQNKKTIAELKALQVDYSNLLSDWKGSYAESIEAAEAYFAKMRTKLVDDVKKYTRKLVGPVSDMEKALSSVTSKFESWITTIKDLGTTTSELLLIQENWLASIQAAADKAIFDPFESVLEDLLLLEAQVGGTSKSDYYLSKYQAALAGDEWIAASEYLLEWYNAQDEATSAWESVTTSVEGLVKSIDDVINSIKYSSLNVSLPTAIADLAEQDYATLKAAALAGGTSDIEDFISFATTYLQKTQESLKSSSEYQAAYDQVMSDLVSFQDKLIAGDYDQKIYNELSDLNENLLQIGTNLESHLVNLRAAFESGFNPADYAGFAKGGIASGPTSGYVAALHGREAVIPLDGGDIPVKITGASTGQPLSINVYIGNEQLDTHITRQADMIRVKSNRRTNIPTQRLF